MSCKNIRFIYTFIPLLLIPVFQLFAQNKTDTTAQNWNFHFQQTTVTQYHPAFHAMYSGAASLQPKQEIATSLTSTMFFGRRLWKGAELYFNPEMSGGKGFSSTLGVAGFPNGEIYRVGDPTPTIYVARCLITQSFPLSKEYEFNGDEPNSIAGKDALSFIAITAGKMSIADYFDDNNYSHDPRTQFLNWSLMSNAAWDYPANTRGYTYGITMEYVAYEWYFTAASSMMPKEANGSVMDLDIAHAHSETLELERTFKLGKKSGIIRLLGFYSHARMGNYKLATLLQPDSPDITLTRTPGRTKYGMGINMEQDLGENSGVFLKASWNDGRNETWVFTEVDRSISAGFVFNGRKRKRVPDFLGFAAVVNGISKDHQNYLKAGGYGFIIGDGKLNYANEMIAEAYYSFSFQKYHFWLTPDYQFIINPAYNKDRGPVHVFSLRTHIEF